MDDDRVRQIAEAAGTAAADAAVKKAVDESMNRWFLMMGVDPSPEGMLEMQRSMGYLRDMRKGYRQTKLTMITSTVAAGVGACGHWIAGKISGVG